MLRSEKNTIHNLESQDRENTRIKLFLSMFKENNTWQRNKHNRIVLIREANIKNQNFYVNKF